MTDDILKGLRFFVCDRKLLTYKWRDDNPDAVERLNEVGIMASNKDNDVEKALFYFKEAIEEGNINAMINGFTVLWTAGYYGRAGLWLQIMNSKKMKSAKCLYNEAMLWYYGENIENNPFNRNINNARYFLDYILSHFDEFIKDDHDIVQESYIFSLKHGLHRYGDVVFNRYEDWKIERWQNRRNLAVIGNNLYYALYNEYHYEPWVLEDIAFGERLEKCVFRNLDELYLEDGWQLCITLGDPNGFKVFNNQDELPFYRNLKLPISKKLRGAPGKRTAWQAYLLYSAYRIMPLGERDLYKASRPIFTSRDLNLNSFPTQIPSGHFDKVIDDIKNLELTDKDVYPRVHKVSDIKYEIESIWWNDWKGLFMERAVIEFDLKSNAINMEVNGEIIIFSYECQLI